MLRVKSLLVKITGLILSCALCLLACSSKPRENDEITLGTITGPETRLVEVAKEVALKEYHLKINIVNFEDYVMPNTALVEGAIDANMFQHEPFLNIVIAKQGYKIKPIAKMFIYPVGFYSTKYHNLSALPTGATIGIPNDPSNGARALRLLAQAKLITLPELNDFELTPDKILQNPHHLLIKEFPAAQLPRVLPDLDAAVINTNYATTAGLLLKNALFVENRDSPYANVIAVREGDEKEEKYQRLIKALHSDAVKAEAKRLFDDSAIPAW